MRLARFAIGIVLVLSASAEAKTKTVYVSTAQEDPAGDGSRAHPWATLEKALPRLVPGDTLVLRGGIYRDVPVITLHGTERAPITLRAEVGETVIFDAGIADFLDEEIETVLSGLTSLIEPLLIVFLGVVVGGIVICMFLPIFKMSEIINPPGR